MHYHQNMSRRRALALCAIPMLSACTADMRPKRPYSLSIDLTIAGSQAVFEIESLVPELGVAIELVFHYENEKQRAELLDKVMNRPINPARPPLARENPMTGVVVPMKVVFKSEREVLFDGIRLSKEAVSGSAAAAIGVFNRGVYGRVVPKGKYTITVTNLQSQPEFAGYKTELKIPGDRKV
jgi:hypothetical protein